MKKGQHKLPLVQNSHTRRFLLHALHKIRLRRIRSIIRLCLILIAPAWLRFTIPAGSRTRILTDSGIHRPSNLARQYGSCHSPGRAPTACLNGALSRGIRALAQATKSGESFIAAQEVDLSNDLTADSILLIGCDRLNHLERDIIAAV